MKYIWRIVALGACAACAKQSADQSDQASAEAQVVVGARTAVAEPRVFIESESAIGVVTQRPGHFAVMAAPAPTRVAKVFVTLGQRVKAGDPLVEFEQQSFDAASRSATAALQSAQQSFDREQRLAAEGIAARKDVEQAAAALAQANAAQVAARRDQQLSTLRAPIGGVITMMDAVLGASADVSQPLVEVTDPDALDVMLELSPSAAARVRVGQAVSVAAAQTSTGSAPAASLGEGVVRDVGLELDSATRTVPVRVVIAHPIRALRVGESVTGQIAVAQRANAIAVPAEALVPEGEGYRVFVVDSAGIAHAREVTIGARNEAYVEIVRGVRAGETVVTYGAYGVSDSAKIATVKP